MELRQKIDEAIAHRDAEGAFRQLSDLWRQEKGSATASFIVARFEKLRPVKQFKTNRIVILRSFTLEPVVPLLRASAFVAGIDLEVQLGDFNAYAQEILDVNSAAYSPAPDSVILAVQTRDIAPQLWTGFADLTSEAVRSCVEQVVRSFEAWIGFFRQHSAANLIIHTLEAPKIPSMGVLDFQSDAGQLDAIEKINDGIRAVARAHRGVLVLNYSALIARHGSSRWYDEQKWLTVRLPISAGCLVHLADEWLRFLVPLAGRTAKAVVVDLDNTLWGGVIGEDGMHGIQLGQEHPGAAYQALQRSLLDLQRKGILLAVCSKNNAEDAMEVFTKHPGMLLKPEHFAAMRINWNEKVQNLREIAAELNIGIDALAFVDDNPVEREQVRVALPEVAVIDLPQNPAQFADAVRDSPFLERLTISQEDRERTALYAAERERSRAEQNFSSKEDFFRSLEQEADIGAVEASTLARIAQLTQKTNQFNLTTRRYTEQQIAEMAARPGWQVLAMRVRDRYGDHGLVGVVITHDEGSFCEIDTFLLSCRVIGRNVETAFLSHLGHSARERGLTSIRGWFLPTKKNAPAKEFYAQHGFALMSKIGDESLWALDLQNSKIPCPDWVKLRVLQEK